MKAITNIAVLGLLLSTFGLGAGACVAPSGAADEASSDNGEVGEAPAKDTAASRSASSLACGLKCFPSEGGATSTLEQIGCSEATLTSRLTAAANAACRASTGFGACSVVMHLSGCLPDGDPQYFIEFGYATYGCNDTTC
jgi:hypothetical protein